MLGYWVYNHTLNNLAYVKVISNMQDPGDPTTPSVFQIINVKKSSIKSRPNIRVH